MYRPPVVASRKGNQSVKSDRIIRWLRLCSVLIAAAGAVMFVTGLALPSRPGHYILTLGIVALILSLLVWTVLLLDRLWRPLVGLPPRSRSLIAPPTYTCPNCGYMLRGVEGMFCPECGTVRPAPIEGEDS